MQVSNQIPNQPQYHYFLGSRIFVFPESRTKLPFQTPDQPFPILKVLKNLIGQELSKVSLPVGMNEPLCALQKNYEMVNCGERIFRTAALTDCPAKRIALSAISMTSSFYLS